MDVRASARYVRVAPNKARQVVRHIRGLDVDSARSVLQLEPKNAARYVLDADDLVITAATVDEGPTLKRFRPRAMGRAYRVRKRTSHITIVLGTEE